MISEGRNEAIPVMPFHELADVVGEAVKSVKSDAIKKSFKHTLFSLPPDGSRDRQEGSKRLTNLIEGAPAFEDLPEKYKFKVHSNVTYNLLMLLLSCLSKLTTLEFADGRKGMQKSTKAELFSVNYVNGGIRTKQARKFRSIRMSVPPFGFMKNGNHNLCRI